MGGCLKLLEKTADAAHPIFALGEILVAGAGRQGKAGDQVPLIGKPGKTAAEGGLEFPLQRFDPLDHRLRIGRGDRPQPIAGGAEAGEPHRYHRRGQHRRPVASAERRQIPEGPLQGLTIVEIRADHHLGMDLQPPLREPGELIAQQGGPGIHQQTAAQFGIGGMHRDIEGREPLLLDPLPVGGGEIGEGEIGAVEKAQAVVVVLEVEAGAAAGGLLVDEAEGTVVIALAQAIEERLGEAESQALVRILLQFHHMELALGILHLKD